MNCPICNSINIKNLSNQSNVAFMNSKAKLDEFKIDICVDCSFVFQSSAYSLEYQEKIKEVYSEYDMNSVFDFPRKDRVTIDSLEFIHSFIKNNHQNVLEIGSNRGDFLYLLKERNPELNILGLEPTKFKNLKVPTINKIFAKELFQNKFDVIILRHVYEHIVNPKDFVESLSSCVEDNGFIYIEVPNLENCLTYLTEDFAPDHVSYFTEYTLIKSFEKYFEIVSIEKSTFLRAVFKKSNNQNSFKSRPLDNSFIEESIYRMYENKNKCIQELIKLSYEKKIIFYGVSYYYYYLMSHLKKNIFFRNCYFYDDNLKENIESRYNLKRVEDFDNSIVVACSDVPYVQDIIRNKIEVKSGNYKIVLPWREI